MDQHAVPKNVLTVEFKLFGNLTVPQFLRIIGGGVLALIIYALNINPLISWPLIIIIVITAIASALIKDFEVRLFAMIRALFVSPRYVWRKHEAVPDVLIEDKQAKQKAALEKAAKDSPKQLTDISLDRLLDARSAAQLAGSDNDLGSNNFDRVYGQEFQPSASQATLPRPEGPRIKTSSGNLAGPQASGQEVRVGPNTTMVVQPVGNTQPRPLTTPVGNAASETQQIETDQMTSLYEQEIQGLQDRLGELTKQGASSEQKQPVIDRINQLYAGIKQVATRNEPAAQVKKLDPKRMVYGVVVDKSGKPIADAQVSVFDTQGDQIGPVAISQADGRFAVEAEFTNGEYVVSLSHPNYQFLKYKIRVQSDHMPAYRFREK